MKTLKVKIVLLLVIFCGINLSAQNNSLKIADITLQKNSSGHLPVMLDNNSDIVAMQFNIRVPNGAKLLTGEIYPTERAINHSVVVRFVGSDNYMVLVYSSDNSSIAAGTGEIFSVGISINNSFDFGQTYSITLEAVILSARNGDNVFTNSTDGSLFVDYPPALEGFFENLQPANNSIVNSTNVNFSWDYIKNAKYDLYLWNESDAAVTSPIICGSSSLNIDINTLEFSNSYKWYVVATNGYQQIVSDTMSFSVRELPDLHVVSLECSDASAEQNITITWKVRNDGHGSTGQQQWNDYVWLVSDAYIGTSTADNDDNLPVLLAKVANVKALNAGEEYENSVTMMLPRNVFGDLYVIVASDMYSVLNIRWQNNEVVNPYNPAGTYLYADTYSSYNQIYEEDETQTYSDNFFYKKIHLEMPPFVDLQVVDVTAEAVPIPTQDEYGQPNMAAYIPTPLTYSGAAFNLDFYSGKQVKVRAKVQNKGNTKLNTSTWRSGVYVSYSADNNSDALVFMTSESSDNVSLDIDETTVVEFLFYLPYSWSGTTYFHVYTDLDQNIREFANTANNWGSSNACNVHLLPHADFSAENLSVQGNLFSGSEINVSYNVRNVGNGVPSSNTWYDKIYIQSEDLSVDNKLLSQSKRNGSFYAIIGVANGGGSGNYIIPVRDYQYEGANYNPTQKVVLPKLPSGTYTISVDVNSTGSVFENGLLSNNVVSIPITVQNPDLSVELISVSQETLKSNDIVAVTWKVKNKSPFDLNDFTIKDAFYASGMLIGSVNSTISISAHGERIIRNNFKIPAISSLNGNKDVYIVVNDNKGIAEDNYSNNTSNPKSVFFVYNTSTVPTVSQGPALSVGDISIQQSNILPGAETDITFTVQNYGTKTINIDVNKEVYLQSGTADLNNNKQKLEIKSVSGTTQSLVANSSVDISLRCLIPSDIKGGQKALWVSLDSNNEIKSKNTSYNSSFTYLYINGNLPDITLSNLSVKNMITTSSVDTLSFVVRNDGSWAAPAFNANIYLSSEATPTTRDIVLREVRIPKLEIGDSVKISETISIDDKYAGYWYITVLPDMNFENLTLNSKQLSKPVNVKQAPLPDLKVAEISVKKEIVAGEKARIVYKIQNAGNSATHSNKWVDDFWLSTSTELNTSSAIKLGNRTHTGVLDKDSIYEQSFECNIPQNASGNYLLFVRTNATNVITETNYRNNSDYAQVFVSNQDKPSDLVIRSISVPAIINAGEPVTFSYTIANVGEYPVSSTLKDVFYLSSDNIFDANDVMIGVASGQVAVDVGNELVRTVSGRVDNVAEGNYYVIVQTNSTHAILENNYDNNLLSANAPLSVQYASLSVGTEVSVNKSAFYKLEVSSALVGHSIAMRLQHQKFTPAGIYISYNDVPSVAKYDYCSVDVQSENKDLIITNLNEGVYYILAQDNSSMYLSGGNEFVIDGNPVSGSGSEMRLSVQEISFGASSLTIGQGGQGGWITTGINGALFDSIMDFRLTQNGNILPAEVVTWDGATQSVVTFNLNDAELGTYDVVSELPEGTNATLPNAFQVVQGKNVGVSVKLDFPSTIRAGVCLPFSFMYANGGTTDDAIAEFLIVMENGYLSLDIKGLEEKKSEIHYRPHGETNAHGYVSIPPGEQQIVRLYCKPLGDCRVSVYILK